MKNYLFILLFLLGIFLSCNSNKEKQIFEALQGDWTDGFGQTFLFKDTLCNYLYPLGNFTGFKIKDDTIVCTTKSYYKKFKEIKFHIVRLDADTLQVEYENQNTKKREKILFGKVKNQLGDNIRIDSVIYLLNYNSDWTPSKFIKTLNDSILIIKDNIGYSRALLKPTKTSDTISIEDFDFINEKFAAIDYKLVEKYSSEYSSFFNDEKPQLCIYVKNELNNYNKTFNIYNLYKYGCIVEEDNYPIELKIFMSYLDNISLFIK